MCWYLIPVISVVWHMTAWRYVLCWGVRFGILHNNHNLGLGGFNVGR